MMLRFLPIALFLTFVAALAADAATITTVCGTGTKGAGGDGGLAVAAELNGPDGLCRTPDGTIYICDTINHRIRKIAPDGTISTVAGKGTKGYSGDGGPAIAAELNEPYEVRVDSAGNVAWVERLSATVRKLDVTTGKISTIAGNGTEGFSGDGGPAIAAQFKQPHSIGFDKADDLYICDISNQRIRKVDMKTGLISTFAGTGEKKAIQDGATIAGSPLNGPRALDFDADGNLWLALREGNAILKLDLKAGTIHHIAGTGKSGFTGNGGPAKEATLSGPKGVAIGPDGNVYFTDTESHTIRMIDLKTGNLELIAGTGKKGDGPDGDPLGCAMNRPHGIFVDKDGIFIGDTDTQRIRKIVR